MPRVTVDTYRSRHHQLHQICTKNKELFSYLSSTRQWEIRDYCLSSDNLPDEELRQHIQDVPIYDFSLPNRAGKACTELMGGRSRSRNVLSP